MPYFWSDESSSVFHGLGLFHKISQLGRVMENFEQERESFNLKEKSQREKICRETAGRVVGIWRSDRRVSIYIREP